MASAVIKTIEYDAGLSCLTVTFTTGRTYDYFAVPANVVQALTDAGSKGAYFNAHIRDVYPCKERRAAAPADASDRLRDALLRSIPKKDE